MKGYAPRISTKHSGRPKPILDSAISASLDPYTEPVSPDDPEDLYSQFLASAQRASSGESEGGRAVALALPAYKAAATELLKELFVSANYDEARAAFLAMRSSFFSYEFVKRAVTFSFDRTDKEREVVSRLLSMLHGAGDLSMLNVGEGFERLLEALDELQVDVPDARALAAKMLARAVVDDLLPPAFLTDRTVHALAGDVVEAARAQVAVRTTASVHATGLSSVPELKRGIEELVKE